MKILKKIIISLIVLIVFFNNFVSLANVIDIGDSSIIERGEMGYYIVQYWNENRGRWMYLTYSRTYYKDKNGERKIAYCVNPELEGVGWIPGEYESYYATIEKRLEDQRLWRIYKNGYPNKSLEELGVETEDDAYLATKQAAYCIIRNMTPDFVKSFYRAGEDPIADQNMEDTYRKGQKVVDLINRLVDIGYNGKETYSDSKIEKVEDLKKNNNDYYSLTYKISCNYATTFNIKAVNTDLEGVFITDIKGNKKDSFKANESFKIMVPKKSIKEKEYNIKIDYEENIGNYPVYYAKSQIDGKQNYVILDKNEIRNNSFNLKIYGNKSNLNIIKIDEETEEPLEGVKFEVKKENGEKIGTYTTDKNGKISIINLLQGEVLVQEIETKNNYVLNNEVQKIKLEYDSTYDLVVKNQKIKGKIKVIKTAEEDNNALNKKAGDPIANVKFEIYDDSNNIVDTIVTDDGGIAISKDLEKGTYKIKEIESGECYKLNEEIYTVEINENNQVIDLNIKNKSENPGLDVEKVGNKEVYVNQEIKYEFDIRNTGDTDLSKFTWFDLLPYEYAKITKMSTGIYNQDINYNIYYKTNKSDDYVLLKENVNSLENNYIDLSNIQLSFNEEITEIKVDFGNVKVGFSSVQKPNILVKTNSDLGNGTLVRNETKLEGYNRTFKLQDTDETETEIKIPPVENKKLPRTGF